MAVRGATLDDEAAVAAADPGGMLELAASLGNQLREGFALARSVNGLPDGEGVRSVLLCGMGGSGVAGDIFRSLYADRLPVPIVVSKGYRLPEFCGRDTLVMAASYSGATEETLSLYGEAVARGCRLVTVSAGGELSERSVSDEVAHVAVPEGVPVPRAALGFLAAAPIGVLESMELIPPAEEDVLAAASSLDAFAGGLLPGSPTAENLAKRVAQWLGDRTAVVWGSEGLAEAPALRWKTQLNENAKVPAFHSVLPELDHNEIEGWSEGTGASFGAIILRHETEHPRTEVRVEATLEAIAAAGLEAFEVWAEGTSPLEVVMSLAMSGDFASTYLGILRGVDPMAIPVLSGLKERLRG